jgi:hypothetical protein
MKQIEKIMNNCDTNHQNMGQHIDKIALKFSENTVDLSQASEGFQRELERITILFNEL